jgi:hypothetical protein
MTKKPTIKKSTTKKTSAKKSPKPKSIGLFDHINHIRKIQSKDYFDNLTEDGKKTFNHYMIIKILSMDEHLIEEMGVVSKYFDKIPSNRFYELLINIVPKTNGFSKYIKSKSEKINENIINCLCKKFEIGTQDAIDYCDILFSSDTGIEGIKDLLREYAYSDGEINKIIKI